MAFPELSKDLKYGNLDDCQVYVVKWLSDKSFAVNCKIWGGTISKKPVFSKDYIYTIGEGYQEKE